MPKISLNYQLKINRNLTNPLFWRYIHIQGSWEIHFLILKLNKGTLTQKQKCSEQVRKSAWIFKNFWNTQTHNHWVRKQKLKNLVKLVKLLSVCLRTKWLWVQTPLQSLNSRYSTCFKQDIPWHSGNYRVQIHS